ncbi:MAG TPA: cupin domain-containing protein [bacterium]|jgi:quercetin dioxygenase-like cupin family protein
MADVFRKEQLAHFRSTRDTRDRLDLITEQTPVRSQRLRADRIIYHPGDTSARHYHVGAHQLFVVLAGRGLLHVPDGTHRLERGAVAVVAPGEEHWFENDTAGDFSFVEFWAPPPEDTVWVVEDDC